MDRTSKLFILAWAVVALLIECYYLSGGWPATARLAPLLLIAAAAVAWRDRRIVAPVLAAAYFHPVLIFLATGRYHVLTSVAWLAPLFGVIAADAIRDGWHVPTRWRVPLVSWVAGVCVTAPIVALRAVDFRWELLFRGRLPYEALGGLPLLTVSWTLHVALLLAIGLLWFDWLCGLEPAYLERYVAMPLGIGVLVLAVVAAYQMGVDVSFWNPTVYAGIHRATGTMMDANVSGALAGMWIGGWWAIVAGRRRMWALLPIVLLLWLTVWATGSRTGFACAGIVSLFTVGAYLRTHSPSRRLTGAIVAGVVAVAALLFVVGRHNTRVVGPLTRMVSAMPEGGAWGVADELWNRNGYGLAATRAIAAYPLFGLGVGAFNEMAGDFAGWLPPDNAQNWYRHQLVELGLVGSVGWMVFVLSFGWWVVRRHAGERPSSPGLRGAIVALALISLLGVPGQDPAVSITFWTMAAWYVTAASKPRAARSNAPAWAWVATLFIVIVFAAGTFVSATGPLRLPARVQRSGGEYLYGFYWPEPDGEGGEYRWARRVATAVVPVQTRSLELTLRINHADLAAHPTRAQAWVNGRQVIDTTLTSSADSVTVPVMLPPNQGHMVVDTKVSRAVTAPPPDGRELGVMVRWRFRPTSR